MSLTVASEFDKANTRIAAMEAEVRTSPNRPLPEFKLGDLLAEFRYMLDLKERIEATLKKVDKSIFSIKEELIARSIAENTDYFANDLISVTIKESEKIKVSGDWPELLQILVDAGYGGSVQRRITEKHILDGFYAGDFRLPDHMELYPYRTATQRRKAAK